ncbi:MAG: hypothetical protein M1825_004637 [Sarcosagium campestre]|nr:MAG: hypothetical protein M1825_004637 [Sarcosagium campestre]
MGKRKLGALEKVDADLANLQYKIRRDPLSYREDFIKQYEQYEAQREIFTAAPSAATSDGIQSFKDLVDFVAHVANCYEDIAAKFPDDLITLLSLHHTSLDPELREKLVGSLSLLRKKEVISSVTLLHALFPILTTTPSKTLRAILFQKILSDLRNSNANHTDHRLNRTIQAVLFNLLSADRASPKGIWAVKVTRELWRRQVWTDAKAVEIMKEASLSDNDKVTVGGVRFFLGGDKEREEAEDESSDEDDIDVGKLKHQTRVNKKSKKKANDLRKAVATVKKKEQKKKQPHPLNFSALHLLHDPQGLAESLFSKHLQNTKSKLNLEQKLLVLQLISRLVGLHKLTIVSLYSYFLKYITPRQASVTSFLASLAQASHNLVPPDALEPLVQKIANEFISEAAASEVASAGLNAIREICVRQPLAMSDTLLQDLVLYRKSKDKGVMMAAKGLLSLYREVGADMLKKRDRGKAAALGLRSGERKEQRFGEEEAGEIEGLELLEEWKREERQKRRAERGIEGDDGDSASTENEDEVEAEGWGAWDVQDDYSDDSVGWINVNSDDEIDISDSDDEDTKPAAKKPKTDADGPQGSENGGPEKQKAIPTIATKKRQQILTPADLAKLQELRLEAGVDKIMGNKKRKSQEGSRHRDDPLTADDIEGLAALSNRNSKEAKLAAAAAGKTDRSEHKSTQAMRVEKKRELGKSTTNKEKARKKNMLMTIGKAKGKQKRSLVETKRVLKAHVARAKRGGKRGNIG